MIVVDASCLLELLLQSAKSEEIGDRLLAHDGALCAPHLIDVEVSHVLRRYWLAGDLSEQRGREAIADMADFPIERFSHVELLHRCWQLRNNLTAYDAMYIALAEALDATLLTYDQRLADSAGHKAQVEKL